jgi:hypothetical protein
MAPDTAALSVLPAVTTIAAQPFLRPTNSRARSSSCPTAGARRVEERPGRLRQLPSRTAS